MNEPRLLDDAVGALREQPRGSGAEANATRARVLASLRAEQRRRSRLLFVVLPIAATFLFSTAWAASTGRLQTLVTQLQTSLGPLPAAIPLATNPARASSAPPFASARVATTAATTEEPSPDSPADPVPPAAPLPAPPAQPPADSSVAALAPAVSPTEPSVALSAGPRAAEPAPRPEVAPAASVTKKDESDALYRVAHEAHFVEQNPQKALKAWDAYLAAPGGRFSSEARYNRALTLIRLGRRDEAKSALRPFAAGKAGSYRQHEASQLIEALGG